MWIKSFRRPQYIKIKIKKKTKRFKPSWKSKTFKNEKWEHLQNFPIINTADLAIRVWFNRKIPYSCFYNLHQYIKCSHLKTVSSSNYFHLSYSLFSQILCYTNSLTFQDLIFSKNYIADNVPDKFDNNRPRSTSNFFFQVDGIYLCHWLIIFLPLLFQRIL